MSAFKATGRARYTIKVPVLRDGRVRWVNRPSGTMDGNTAKKMTQMVNTLGPADLGAHDILDALVDRSLTIPQCWAVWQQPKLSDLQKIKAIRALLADSDLLLHKAAWVADITSRSSADNAGRYAFALSTLVDAIGVDGTLPRSAVTVAALKGWMAGLTVSAGTKRRHYAGVMTFFDYCVSAGAMDANPLKDKDVKQPRVAKPRTRHLSADEAKALADAQASPFRELSALLAGTGIEVGVALKLTVADVDVAHQEIRARGKKNSYRDRITKVAAWAWPYVLTALSGKLPGARLFPVDGQAFRESHRDACDALKITDYTNRDARHTYAVRMVKAGAPMQQISKQLGHRDSSMIARVYGVYEPSQDERDHWERIATARDAATTKQEKKG